jgi:plasmid stabilization system protein ParE
MAKRKIVWSSKAKFDLIEILEYFYIRNGSKTYSIKLNSKIRKAIRLLSKHPFLGLKSDVENFRVLVEGDYAIFNQIEKDALKVITIWDCRKNPDTLPAHK